MTDLLYYIAGIVVICVAGAISAAGTGSVLIFTGTEGYEHDVIDEGSEAIRSMLENRGYQVWVSDDTTLFRPGFGERFDVLIFFNTSGNVLNESQQEVMRQFVEAGGGFVGVHAATDTEYEWEWYGDVIGAYFTDHPDIQPATIQVVDPHHPTTRMLPIRWDRTDEWYNFDSDLSEEFRILCVLDESTYAGGKHEKIHPFVWCREVEQGRMWYTAGGHTPESYRDTVFMEHLYAGVRYVSGEGVDPVQRRPQVYLLDSDHIYTLRKRLLSGDTAYVREMADLKAAAESALQEGVFSVTDKPFVPPSGDKHDYMSIGPYWWPNAESPDSLPYVRRDGQANPERNAYDIRPLIRMTENVRTLALAFFLTNNEIYAEHAAALLRTWFLHDSTMMNPHLKFGQAIPGRSEGREYGIIETSRFAPLLDAVELLEYSRVWESEDRQQLQSWFGTYLDWLLHDQFGEKAAAKQNNHGTWYDVQTARIALFVGKDSIARDIVQAVPDKRINVQITPAGKQPHELDRTKAFSYSVMNLKGLVHLARIGNALGVDLWNYTSKKGQSIKRGIEFLIPYGVREKEWPYQQISGMSKARRSLLLLLKNVSDNYPSLINRTLMEKIATTDFQAHAGAWMFPGPGELSVQSEEK